MKVADRFIEPIKSSVEITDILKDKIRTLKLEDAFYVADIAALEKQFSKWRTSLPNVHPFYAVKCNDDEVLVSHLEKLGANFDCASKGEIAKVLKTGCDPSRIIFANPCKQPSHIRYAKKAGVTHMTFDNEAELFKIKELFPEASMVLRILPDDSRSVCRLGCKFGASLASVPALLSVAKELKINVTGISFHVGSGCFDAVAFYDAICLAREAFDIGKGLGFQFTLLDIGGGFPGHVDPKTASFDDIVAQLNLGFQKYFPSHEFPHLSIISEPGRYFASSTHTLACLVMGKRVVRDTSDASDSDDGMTITHNDQPAFMYYINDGVYGSFNNVLYDHAHADPHVLLRYDSNHEEIEASSLSGSSFKSSLWGPTCDGMDCIMKNHSMTEMQVGEWLFFPNMGAYTRAAACSFNGFEVPSVFYVRKSDSSFEDQAPLES
eukprot:Sdes_comp22020_c0_seq1m20558